MPKKDINQLAKSIVEQATSEQETSTRNIQKLSESPNNTKRRRVEKTKK